MSKIKILVIAPYEGMRESILNKISLKDSFDITVMVGNLEEGARMVTEVDLDNYDILMSRGGTLELIKNISDVPVVEINISVYDVLRSIKLAENYTQKFAIIGYPSITESAKTLCNLLQYNIDIFTLDNNINVTEEIQKLKNLGYGMVLSDVIGFNIAKAQGLNAILIMSGTESIENAFTRAKELYQNMLKLSKDKKMYLEVIKTSDRSIFVHDINNNLIFYHIAKTHNNISFDEVLEKITEYTFTEDSQEGEIIINRMQYSFNRTSAATNHNRFIITFIICQQVSAEHIDGITIFNSALDTNNYHSNFEHISYVGNTDITLMKYGENLSPIIIIGEQGTGKDKAAYTIYQSSPYSMNSFHQIDIGEVTEKTWNYLINNVNSPLNQLKRTLYFKNIHLITSNQKKDLEHYIEFSNLTERNKLIFSLIPSSINNNLVELTKLLEYKHNSISISLEPLRVRKSEILNIATHYINLHNLSSGKEIVGFESEAISVLHAYNWPDNLDELKTVLRECVLKSDSPYIKGELISKVIQGRQPSLIKDTTAKQGYIYVDSKKTLDEITLDLVQFILTEENNNQQKTASRLGISRSTLWRMLKNNK